MHYTFTPQEQADSVIVEQAGSAIGIGDFEAAIELLVPVVERAPSADEYDASRGEGDTVLWRYWDEAERDWLQQEMAEVPDAPEIIWLPTVYPKALHMVGFITFQMGEADKALQFLSAAIEMDPSQPQPMIEIAVILQRERAFEESNEMFLRAFKSAPLHTPWTLARMMRGQGFNQIELGNLEIARELFENSLEFDPSSQLAVQELAYIESLENGGPETDADLRITGHGGDLTLPGQPGPGTIALVEALRELRDTGALTEEELLDAEHALLDTPCARSQAEYFRCNGIVKMIAALHVATVEGDFGNDDFEAEKAKLLAALVEPKREDEADA